MRFNLTLSLFLGIPITVIILLWLFKKEPVLSLSEDEVWECEICLGVYSAPRGEEITKCPFCGSYNKKQEART
jgi:hypothetical protein